MERQYRVGKRFMRRMIYSAGFLAASILLISTGLGDSFISTNSNPAKIGSDDSKTNERFESVTGAVAPVAITGHPHGSAFVDSQISDPLINSVQPEPSACDHNNLSLKEGNHILQPGVYCGGIISLTASRIELMPGTYTIRDGPFYLGGSVVLSGENVGFFFQGNNAVFGFGGLTTLELTAPTTGPMAGILFFEGRSARPNREFVIRSYDARLMEGTIYLPKGRLVIESESHVGHSSKWTAIVVNQLEINDGADLELNADYADSNVPLPEGLRSSTTMAYAAQ